ncbi:kinetoplastid kinetochore protein 12 [Trypanosoma equiperdum]|uniref:Kinetoplastid kinetochore protein 12 n=2 Tax=Trypanozoon TaxID=39700 RepID=Q580F6_TRYB2|nr:hypothetical protein, conserved [Trypanosoma brucei brucei TREU927]AAX79773.1 hypothetical protein, conserved [Trypanosoma brucei]AAZ12935.1 hypothetical protein, conserved [Trypanosoma brucei brucei TREU927]SCU67452.1 kinetoplastid kinetochore protein 12 [Trypanosoma equiperdum]
MMASAPMAGDYQTRSAAISEKMNTVQLRRRIVEDLRRRAESLSGQLRQRQQDLQRLIDEFTQKKASQEAKISEKRRCELGQKELLDSLLKEEERLTNVQKDYAESIGKLQQEVAQRQATVGKVSQAREELTRVKMMLEEKDREILALERNVEKVRLNAKRRHEQFEMQLPDVTLPCLGEVERGGLEETASESILLIGDPS